MNILQTLLSGFILVGSPVDIALQEASMVSQGGDCRVFAQEAADRLRKLGKWVWVRDATITRAGGRNTVAQRHRFVCWMDRGEEYCADNLYPYRSTWNNRKISSGIF